MDFLRKLVGGKAADAVSKPAAPADGAAEAFARGLACMATGHHAEALVEFDRVLVREPLNADALSKRGSALMALGRPAEALASRSEERRVGKECRSRWSPYH